jgi:hypothetical protein
VDLQKIFAKDIASKISGEINEICGLTIVIEAVEKAENIQRVLSEIGEMVHSMEVSSDHSV